MPVRQGSRLPDTGGTPLPVRLNMPRSAAPAPIERHPALRFLDVACSLIRQAAAI